MDKEKIGKFVAKVRKEKNMTQQELAKKLNVTEKVVSKWENGKCRMDIALLKKLGKCLDVSIIELINGKRIDAKDVSSESSETIYKTLEYAEKLKKNKIKIILNTIVSVILFVCLVFVLYKGSLLFIYKFPIGKIDEIASGLEVKDVLKIYKRTIEDDEYLIVDDIKIRNDFKDFTEEFRIYNTDPFKFIKILDNGDKLEFSISSNKRDYTDIFFNYAIYEADGGEFAKMSGSLNNKASRKYFLVKNNINNDIDFFKYIYAHGYHKSNIFMSDRKIKMNYQIDYFINESIPVADGITLIEGDYLGYIINNNDKNIKTVHIWKNDKIYKKIEKVYSFTFSGKQFTDEYLVDILSTLEIK